jgi:hypothetical protein
MSIGLKILFAAKTRLTPVLLRRAKTNSFWHWVATAAKSFRFGPRLDSAELQGFGTPADVQRRLHGVISQSRFPNAR